MSVRSTPTPGSSRPARRRRPASSGPRRPVAHRPEPVRSELDLALAAAQEAPAPPERSFAQLGLPDPLVSRLARSGVHAPFAIQARTLPDGLAGRDILGRAQTGSGKTLGFGLPLLARLADGGRRGQRNPRGLVLVPTRELARQVADVLGPLAQSVGLKVTTVYGGVSMGKQIDALHRGVDVVVACPGRLIDLMERSVARLDEIEATVLDEADHMADLGFLPAVRRILDATPRGGQRMLFSATLDRGVERLVTDYLHDPAVHAVAPAAAPVESMDHQVLVTRAEDKVAVAAEIAARPARTLVFVRTKHGADRLARQLTTAGAPAAAIHGNLNQNQRQRALDGFAAGSPRVLVATDVAARGIHVDDVDLVVHFDPPADHKDYLHRSGRTARAGTSGTVVALALPDQVSGLAALHRAAGVDPASHRVRPGDEAVRTLAESGEPVPPAPVTPARTERPERPARPANSAHRRPPRRRYDSARTAS